MPRCPQPRAGLVQQGGVCHKQPRGPGVSASGKPGTAGPCPVSPSLGQDGARGHGGAHQPRARSGARTSRPPHLKIANGTVAALCTPTVGDFWRRRSLRDTAPRDGARRGRAPLGRSLRGQRRERSARRMRRGTCAGSGPRGGPASPARPSLGSAGVLTPSVRGRCRSGPAALRALILSPGPAPPATGGAHQPWLRLRAAPGGRRTSPDAPPSPAPRDPTAGASQLPAARSARGRARPGTWGEWEQGHLWVPGLAGPRRAVFRLPPTLACAPRGCPRICLGRGLPGPTRHSAREEQSLRGGSWAAGARGTARDPAGPSRVSPPSPSPAHSPSSRRCRRGRLPDAAPTPFPRRRFHPLLPPRPPLPRSGALGHLLHQPVPLELGRPGGRDPASGVWGPVGVPRRAAETLATALTGRLRPRPGLCLLSSPRPRGTRSSPGSGLQRRGSFCGPRADPSQDPVSARVRQGAKRRRALPTWSANRLEPRGSIHTRIGTRFPGTARKAAAVDTGSERTDSESLLR